MIAECINIGCEEFTENYGGLCPVCMGLAQGRAGESRKSCIQAQRKPADGVLGDNTGKAMAKNAGCQQCANFIDICTLADGDLKMWSGMAGKCADFRPER